MTLAVLGFQAFTSTASVGLTIPSGTTGLVINAVIQNSESGAYNPQIGGVNMPQWGVASGSALYDDITLMMDYALFPTRANDTLTWGITEVAPDVAVTYLGGGSPAFHQSLANRNPWSVGTRSASFTVAPNGSLLIGFAQGHIHTVFGGAIQPNANMTTLYSRVANSNDRVAGYRVGSINTGITVSIDCTGAGANFDQGFTCIAVYDVDYVPSGEGGGMLRRRRAFEDETYTLRLR